MIGHTDVRADRSADLLSGVYRFYKEGYRLAQACVSPSGDTEKPYDLIYTFEKDGKLTNFALGVSSDDEVESVTGVFPYAYLYENEMKELYGIKVLNINLDFGGHLYKTSIATPFKKDTSEKGGE
jgi:ech hydrogenase subunit D